MTREDILAIMRVKGSTAPIWKAAGSEIKISACISVLKAACEAVLSPDDMAATEKSAAKGIMPAQDIYYQAALMAIFRNRPNRETARNTAHRMADEMAGVIAMGDAELTAMLDAEPVQEDQPVEEQGPAPEIRPVIPKGEPVRKDVPQSELDVRAKEISVHERAGFSTAEIPSKRPLLMLMLPPPPGVDADPDEISLWSASEPWGPFTVGYKHAAERGPRDVEMMDAEVAFYNGPEVILQDTGMPQRLDPEEPEAENAAVSLFRKGRTATEEIVRRFERAYDKAQNTWNPKHAEALAWSGAELIIPPDLSSALAVIAERFPAAGEDAESGKRLTNEPRDPGYGEIFDRACALNASRGIGLGESLLSASFEACVSRSMSRGDPAPDGNEAWAAFMAEPETYLSEKTPEPTI